MSGFYPAACNCPDCSVTFAEEDYWNDEQDRLEVEGPFEPDSNLISENAIEDDEFITVSDIDAWQAEVSEFIADYYRNWSSEHSHHSDYQESGF